MGPCAKGLHGGGVLCCIQYIGTGIGTLLNKLAHWTLMGKRVLMGWRCGRWPSMGVGSITTGAAYMC